MAGDLLRLGRLRRCRRCRLGLGARFGRASRDWNSRSHRPWSWLPFASMNGFGALPLPAAICSIERPEATERSSSRTRFSVALAREFVAMLDQQPVGALAAVAVALHPHQHPAAMQLVAVQGEFQIALGKPRSGSSLGLPVAAVPQLHRAAAILVLREWCLRSRRSRADGPRPRPPAACLRIERGSARHRPGLEDAVEFQPQVVVQPRRGVLLDHEAPLLRRRHLDVARRLRRLLEIALLPVGG